MTGGVVSSTLTVWLQTTLLLHASVAFHVRVAIKAPPPRTFVTVPEVTIVTLVPSQVSSTLGGSKVHGCPHSTMRFVAHVRTGGVVSITLTVCEKDALFEHASMACHTRVAAKVFPQRAFVRVD